MLAATNLRICISLILSLPLVSCLFSFFLFSFFFFFFFFFLLCLSSSSWLQRLVYRMFQNHLFDSYSSSVSWAHLVPVMVLVPSKDIVVPPSLARRMFHQIVNVKHRVYGSAPTTTTTTTPTPTAAATATNTATSASAMAGEASAPYNAQQVVVVRGLVSADGHTTLTFNYIIPSAAAASTPSTTTSSVSAADTTTSAASDDAPTDPTAVAQGTSSNPDTSVSRFSALLSRALSPAAEAFMLEVEYARHESMIHHESTRVALAGFMHRYFNYPAEYDSSIV